MNESKPKYSRGYRQGSSQIKTKVGAKESSFHVPSINDTLVPSSKTLSLNKLITAHATPKISESLQMEMKLKN